MLRSLTILLCLLTVSQALNAQSTDDSKEEKPASEAVHHYTWQTFKDTRIINGHSIETAPAGELKFIISHRFGPVNGLGYELIGLDQSTVRFGLDYAINGWIDVGVGRSSWAKTYDAFAKIKFISQRTGDAPIPVTLAYFTATALETLRPQDDTRPNYLSNQLSYTHQLLLARKFSPGFSLQLMPTLVHRNLTLTEAESNDVFAMGAATRIQLTKVLGIQFEYYYALPGQLASQYRNSLSVGLEFQTKAHVFQIHLSNSTGMIEPLFITESTGSWSDGGVRLGFNITRDFKIRGRKYD